MGQCGGVADKPLFDLPKQMTRVVDKELAFGGIPKHDNSGRVLDMHCLRHTFITMLAKSGVSLQLAQKAARHSSPLLTSNIYTHIGLDDLAGLCKAYRTYLQNAKVTPQWPAIPLPLHCHLWTAQIGIG